MLSILAAVLFRRYGFLAGYVFEAVSARAVYQISAAIRVVALALILALLRQNSSPDLQAPSARSTLP